METIDAPPQCVSQGRQLHPSSGAQSWPWCCCGAPHHALLLCGGTETSAEVPLPSGEGTGAMAHPFHMVWCLALETTEERMKRPFQTGREPSRPLLMSLIIMAPAQLRNRERLQDNLGRNTSASRARV